MPDHVRTLGAKVGETTVVGDGCLVPLTSDGAGGVDGEKWIFDDVLAAEVGGIAGSVNKYPLALTLDQLMELYWRCKVLNVTYGYTNEDLEVVSESFDVTRGAGREAELVLPSTWYDSREAPENTPDCAGGRDGYMEIFNVTAGEPVVKAVLNAGVYTYYPRIEINYYDLYTDGDSGGFCLYGYYGSVGSPQFNGESVTATLTMSDGVALEFDLYIGGGSGVSTNMSFDITVNSYWPHATSLGNPVWDTSDGTATGNP